MVKKALAAFLALPGIFGVLVPAVLLIADPKRVTGYPVGALIIAVGLIILVRCVWDFYVSGKGTLAPWAPPKNLVVVGLYRYMRNPMYIGVLLMVAGTAMLFGSPLVLGYCGLLAVGFHLRVVWSEEPWLAEQFGAEWRLYSESVSRWLPHPPAKPKESA
jgi:protein-S-isoprenylcysteine O-methyltransferase Ste14